MPWNLDPNMYEQTYGTNVAPTITTPFRDFRPASQQYRNAYTVPLMPRATQTATGMYLPTPIQTSLPRTAPTLSSGSVTVTRPIAPTMQQPTPTPAGGPQPPVNLGRQGTYNPEQAYAVFAAGGQTGGPQQQPGNTGYNYAYQAQAPQQYNADVPYGVDPNWWQQFQAEHPYQTKDGRTVYLTPEQVYSRDGEYAVAHALSDKAWGDQFYRTYGRPPSEYDWKASYYQRQNAFYG